MKRHLLILSFSIFFVPFLSRSQSIGDYRTVGTGNWASPGTWETYTGLGWAPALASPTYLNGNIDIRNGHTVTVTANTTVDNVTVDAGGTLVLSSNAFTLGLLGLDNLVVNGSLEINGGDLNMVVTSSVTINGSVVWTDGDIISGTVSVGSGGVLTLNTPAPKDLQSSTININSGGTMNWNGGDINLNVLGGINSNGLINTSCNNSISGLGTFNNNSGGVFAKTSTGTTTFNIIVTSILGAFKGVGTYNFNNLFLNAGTISPGLSPGIVIVTYADLDPVGYPLLGDNSDIDIEIKDDSGPGIGHDQIVKNNSITLKGTLRVTETGSVPDGSYAIVLVTSGTINGDFDNVILPPGYTYSKAAQIVLVTKSTSTLPVKLTNFTARKVDNKVQLNWQTFSENNSDRFEIETATPNGAYIKIGEIKAAGNSDQLINYQFTDNSPAKGLSLYRLKQIDRDNKFGYSPVRWIKFDDAGNQLYVFPTLTNGTVTVLTHESTLVELYDLRGARLLRKQINNNGQIDLSIYASGTYFLRNQKDGRTYQVIKR